MMTSTASGDLLRALRDRRAVEVLGLLAGAVVRDEVVARLDEVLRHRAAHDPKPDESYRVGHSLLLL